MSDVLQQVFCMIVFIKTSCLAEADVGYKYVYRWSVLSSLIASMLLVFCGSCTVIKHVFLNNVYLLGS